MTISREIEQEKLKRLEQSVRKNDTGPNTAPSIIANTPMEMNEIPRHENLSQESKQNVKKKNRYLVLRAR